MSEAVFAYSAVIFEVLMEGFEGSFWQRGIDWGVEVDAAVDGRGGHEGVLNVDSHDGSPKSGMSEKGVAAGWCPLLPHQGPASGLGAAHHR